MCILTGLVGAGQCEKAINLRQDVFALLGHFQSYTMGNILSAQFYAAALKAHRDIPQEIATGQFRTLHTWLRDHIYQHGSKFVPNDLVKHATGKAMTIRPYLDYLREKYGALYRLPASA